MLFKNKDHEVNYNSLLQEIKRITPNHQAVAYLLALEPLCFEHCHDLYDFHKNHLFLLAKKSVPTYSLHTLYFIPQI